MKAILLAVMGGYGCASVSAQPDGPAAVPSSDDAAVAVTDAAQGPASDGGTTPVAQPDAKKKDAREHDTGSIPDAFLGMSRCPQMGVLFCDDFETGTVDPKKWSEVMYGGSVKIETTRAARGRYSAHIKIPRTGTTGFYLQLNQTFPLAGNRLFIRAFVWVETPAPEHHTGMIEVMESAGGNDLGYVLANHGLDEGAYPNQFGVWWYSPARAGEYTDAQYSKSLVPLGRWACFEWELRGTTNELALWVDDVSVADMSINKNWTAPKNPTIKFGTYVSHPEDNRPDGINFWFDEIAIDSQKIGCSR